MVTQTVDPAFAVNGEFYINEKDGRTHIRLPAGGAGGGVTAFADVVATEDQHLAFLDSKAKAKEAEALMHREAHKAAHAEMKKKTELYMNPDDGRVHKRLPSAAPNVLDPLATPDEEKAFLAKAAGEDARRTAEAKSAEDARRDAEAKYAARRAAEAKPAEDEHFAAGNLEP